MYPKIPTLWQRDPETHKVVEGNYSSPELEYLSGLRWRFTEKVDGTNVRVFWDGAVDLLKFGGRTDRAHMPMPLLEHLQKLFKPILLDRAFDRDCSVVLYGEGYGAGIQNGGKYTGDGSVDFALFDVLVGDWWLRWDDVLDVASKLSVRAVPELGSGTLEEAAELAKLGFSSQVAAEDRPAEGIVARPWVDLRDRRGSRLLVKLKTKDFG